MLKSDELRYPKYIILILAILIILVVQIPTDIYLPAFTAIKNTFHTTNEQIQYTISIYMFLYGLSHFIYGPLVDVHGRRIIILISTLVFLTGTLTCAIATNFTWFLLGRILQGLSAGAFSTISRAVLRDSFSEYRLSHVSSILSIIFAIIPPFAPVLGAYLKVHLGWRSIFSTLSIYILLVFILLYFFLPETLREREHIFSIKNSILQYRKIFSNKIFLKYALCSSLTLSGMIVYVIESPVYFLEKLQISPIIYGWLFIVTALCLVLGSAFNMMLIKHKFVLNNIMFLASIMMMLASILMLIIWKLNHVTIASVLVFIMIYLFGAGIIFPNAFTLAMSGVEKNIGITTSAYGAIQMLGVGIITSCIAYLTGDSQLIMACSLLMVSLLTFSLLFYPKRSS